MSAFQRVIDYMAGMPDAANHREIFYQKFLERENTRQIQQVDGTEIEKKLVPPGERNVVRNLNAQPKFTLNSMNMGFELRTVAIARTNDSGRDRIERSKGLTLDFKAEREWALLPATASVVYPMRDTALNILDREQRRLVLSCCNSLGADSTFGLSMITVTEKLNLPSDMRHLFTKMYLTLMDYNLAVTSKCTDMQVCPDTFSCTYPRATDEARLAAVVKHEVVVDADGFTPEELGLLLLAGQQYPSVWYAGDNIYNACQMEADDVAFISSGDFSIDKSLRWGSPDRLYNMIWGIAAKFGALDCLVQVISEMRGKPKMMSDILKRTDMTAVASDMPLSRSLVKAFGDRAGTRCAVSQYPGYFSTSSSLITDLLYGKLFEASATCLVEELGGIGKALSGMDPSTNKTFNGLLRDYGLDHANLQVNSLLVNWMSLSGAPITWAFGRQLKRYLVVLASELVNDIDIDMPQLVEMIPYMSSHNTTWGCSRGWRGTPDLLRSSSAERKANDQAIAAVAWIMGTRGCRPRVFRNTISKTDLVLGRAEYELKAQCGEGCTVESIAMWMGQDVGGRVDENERISSMLIKTEYAGSKCSLVYDRGSDEWKIPEPEFKSYNRFVQESMKGQVPDKGEVEIRPVTFGGQPSGQGNFSYLKTMANAKINVSSRPTYARNTADGDVYVYPYLMDGEKTQVLQPERPVTVAEGEELTYGEIEVPGDGQCAVHAVMEDLKMHGYVGIDSVNRARDMFSDSLSTKYWHDANEVAAILNDMDYNLDVLDMSDEGHPRLTRYGSDQSRHRVGIIKRGEHFNAVKLGRGANKTIVSKVDEGKMSPEEYTEALSAMRKAINFNR